MIDDGKAECDHIINTVNRNVIQNRKIHKNGGQYDPELTNWNFIYFYFNNNYQ